MRFNEMDKDRNGKLSVNEFLDYYGNQTVSVWLDIDHSFSVESRLNDSHKRIHVYVL